MKKLLHLPAYVLIFFLQLSCSREEVIPDDGYSYFQVGFKSNPTNWRDTAFVVRTKSEQLLQLINTQLSLPVEQRKLVVGALARGNAGYNKNSSHEFKWHLQEDAWGFADVTIEIYDGTPYSEVDQNIDYWLNTVKAYGPWSSYIRKKLPGKP